MKNRNEPTPAISQIERARLLSDYRDVCHRMTVLKKRHNGEKSREFHRLRKRANELEKKLLLDISA